MVEVPRTVPEAVALVSEVLDERDEHVGDFVCVSSPHIANHYVQFVLRGDGIVYAEAAGSCDADDDCDRLGDGQLAALERMGWEPPAVDRYNFRRTWPVATPTGEVVRSLFDTLLNVYGPLGGEGVLVCVRVVHFCDDGDE